MVIGRKDKLGGENGWKLIRSTRVPCKACLVLRNRLPRPMCLPTWLTGPRCHPRRVDATRFCSATATRHSSFPVVEEWWLTSVFSGLLGRIGSPFLDTFHLEMTMSWRTLFLHYERHRFSPARVSSPSYNNRSPTYIDQQIHLQKSPTKQHLLRLATLSRKSNAVRGTILLGQTTYFHPS